jgi:hypothetical protein
VNLYKAVYYDISTVDDVVVGFFDSVERLKLHLIKRTLDLHDDFECIEEVKQYVDNVWDIEKLSIYSDLIREGWNVYYCAGDNGGIEDVHICIARNIEQAKDIFACMLDSSNGHMRSLINDMAINMSAAEDFYHDEKGYMFNLNKPRVREDIVERFSGDPYLINEYIDYHFERNVREFFKNNPELGKVYLERAFEDKDIEFPDELFVYFWRHKYLDDYVIREVAKPSQEASEVA